MSNDDRPEDKLVLAEQDVARILELAVQIEGDRDTRVTVQQLREAALEVGVSPSAFEAAIAEFARIGPETEPEVATGSTAVAPPERIRFFPQIRTGVTIAFGLLFGVLGGSFAIPSLSAGTIALAGLVVVGGALRLMLSHRRDRSLLPFIMDSFWLWTSFTVGIAMSSWMFDAEVLVGTVFAIIITAVVGGIFVKRGEPDDEPPRLGPAS